MNIQYINKAFRAEWLKIKGLGLLYIGIILGILIPVLVFIVSIFKEDARQYDGIKTEIAKANLEGTLSSYGGFFMLLFIILAASRICQTDHKNNGWTFMESQPLSKLSIYTGKFLTAIVVCTISIISYLLATVIFANLLQVIFPMPNYSLGINLGENLHLFLRLWMMSLGIISIQLMLSVVIKGFVWPFMIGFLGFVINIVAQIRGERYDFVPYNNIQTSLSLKNTEEMSHFFNYSDYLLLFWSIVFFIFGYQIYSRRGIKPAFFGNKITVLKSIGTALLMLGAYFLITQPRYAEKIEGKTIIEGEISSTIAHPSLLLISKELNLPIVEIPIKNGKFHWETKENIPLGLYQFKLKDRNFGFIFTKGDHIILSIKEDVNNFEYSSKGSRIAEINYAKETPKETRFFTISINDERLKDKPEEFYKLAQEDYENSIKELQNYRTNENYHLSKDFIEIKEQEFAMDMLSQIKEYQKNTSFTDKKFAPPAEFLAQLNECIKKPNEFITTTEKFRNWKLKSFLPNEGSKNPDSIIMAKLALMPKSKEKDGLLATQLINYFKLTNDKEKRLALLNDNLKNFQNPNYAQFVSQELKIITNQQKGSPLPAIILEDAEGKKVDFSKFKGKMVVVDFWATWCGPCRQTKPQFEFQARKFEYANDVVFIAISVDSEKQKWKNEIKNNKSQVQQYWMGWSPVMKALGINGIPRFMMVDREGKMHNATMPFPSDSNFEELINEVTMSRFYRF
ncbi:MAG: redoxin family protein [Bacteroidetes bacterium]|nr:redoxin family protein [Bacteroidota bacterium]